MKNEDEYTHSFSEPTDSGNISTDLFNSSSASAQEADSSSQDNKTSGVETSGTENTDIEVSDITVSDISGAAASGSVSLNSSANFGNIIPVSGAGEGINPTQIIIIGTAHVSEKSVREVRETIEREKPDIVAVELDHNRYKGMTDPDAGDSEISFKDVLKPGQTFYYLLYGFLAYMQRKMGEKLGVQPGAEMKAAVESAQQTGAGIALIDRDIQITFKRFLAKLSFGEKLKMAYSIVKGMFFGDEKAVEFDINNVTDQDVVSAMIEEFRHLSPTAASVLIDERDAYLAGNVLRTVQAAGPGKKIVVVIGAGHRQGVMNYLNKPSDIPNLAELDVIPKKRFGLLKFISYGIVALVLFLFAYITYAVITSPEMTPEILLIAFGSWFLINGVLSAAGALLAGGKLRSAAVAFMLSWFTSINPLLAAGWFAGLAEAGSRKPTTKDMKNMMNAETFKELNKNSFFKVIYVAALTNIGSMIGTFVGAYVVLRLSGIDIIDFIKTIVTGLF
ncbi:MAG: TraB/GumN family protein [Methanosarcinales archaeon]|jgi:pheromone shutdown-related protein TraB|nr:TraB/GumN family protein [Methanosarcinales archaeon]